MLSDTLHRAARVFEQKPGCGCAKRQAKMNAVIPGSGDAAKTLISGIGRGLHGAARLLDPAREIVAPQTPALLIPKSQAERPRPAQHRPSPWTVPPVPAPGWEVLDQCDRAMLFRSGHKYIVWSIVGGVYSRSHTFSDDEAAAQQEFQGRCP